MAVQALRSSMGSNDGFPPQMNLHHTPSPPSLSRTPIPMTSPIYGLQPVEYLHAPPQSSLRSLSAHIMSPSSDIVGPSPVTSNGTETTEIEDEEATENNTQQRMSPTRLHMLKTNIPVHIREAENEESVSVIHAPENFHDWMNGPTSNKASPPPGQALGIISPPASEAEEKPTMVSPPPISTNVKPAYGLDTSTPQAQNLETILYDPSRLRSSSLGGLQNIPEYQETEYDGTTYPPGYITSPHMDGEGEIGALQAALEECWTLCNTLANLSSIHRERVFNSSGTPDAHERAWKCCWKLCQQLYHSQDESSGSYNVRMNLDLCRDFFQALFDVRQRKDEETDAVLRVSIELNNHLYSAQNFPNLPNEFEERTLEFYITLCHRHMKQRNALAEETDSLLRACWALAEMLFSLRQNSREGKAPDEELLGSAVQACWELCDIFREGWTQIRPDRGTPRPSQVTFPSSAYRQVSDTASIKSGATSRISGSHTRQSSLSGTQDQGGPVKSIRSRNTSHHQPPVQPPFIPETPVTEFEDTPISPESSSPQMPNIMVLGPSNGSSTDLSRAGSSKHWPSGASNMSGYSQGSNKTSSTATTTTPSEDINVARIKVLILKAAMNVGFSRESADSGGSNNSASLQAFVKNLPQGSFGSLPNHATLLQSYKKMVQTDAFRVSNTLPPRGRRVAAVEAAKSVNWMYLRSNQYGFLRDLFKLVFSFPLEEAESRKSSSIVV